MNGVDFYSTYIDKVIGPSEQLQRTRTEQYTDVSRIKPSIPKHLGCCAWIVFVAVDKAAAFDSYPTRLPHQRVVHVVDDFELHTRKNYPNPVGVNGANWENFVCAVIFNQICFKIAVRTLA